MMMSRRSDFANLAFRQVLKCKDFSQFSTIVFLMFQRVESENVALFRRCFALFLRPRFAFSVKTLRCFSRNASRFQPYRHAFSLKTPGVFSEIIFPLFSAVFQMFENQAIAKVRNCRRFSAISSSACRRRPAEMLKCRDFSKPVCRFNIKLLSL